MTVFRAVDLRRGIARLALGAATLGFGTALWFALVHHRWPAIIGAVLWAIVGIAAFLYLWNDPERSTP